MCFFTGTEVGLQGYAALNQIGTAAFSGFVSAYFNTREIAPLVAAIALAATVGCGFTAQLGAMRISEEVDALEVMAIPSLPFLVTTRIIGGLIAIVPLYVVGLLSSYFATRLTVTQFFGQSTGTYDHYFNQFLPPGDVLWSFGKVLGLRRRRDPDPLLPRLHRLRRPGRRGRGRGRAVRTSIVADQRHRPASCRWPSGARPPTVRLAGRRGDEAHAELQAARRPWFLAMLLAGVYLCPTGSSPRSSPSTTRCGCRPPHRPAAARRADVKHPRRHRGRACWPSTRVQRAAVLSLGISRRARHSDPAHVHGSIVQVPVGEKVRLAGRARGPLARAHQDRAP
jgi:hypothetical protein